MTKSNKSPATEADRKKARLAEQLRANLQKRKTQSNARREGKADQRVGVGANIASPQDD